MTALKKMLVYFMAFSVLNLSTPLIAQAGVIGTLEAIDAAQHAQDLATINASLARAEVQQQLSAMGVKSADIQTRIAALTDSEVNMLAGKISTAPAGGDVLAVIGIVFVVLIILEAVGVIDIFTKFP